MVSSFRTCAGLLLVVAHSASGQMAMNKMADTTMNMGCGNTSCMSSKMFMHENHVMHEGMNLDYTCNVGVDFVRGMIPHHAGAVNMCEVLRNATKPGKPEQFLDQLCLDIEKSQVTEINTMTEWLKNKSLGVSTTCKGKTPLKQMDMVMGCGDGTCDGTRMFMHENMVMHGGMALEFTCDAAVDFVRGMIPHHKGAIKMCEILRNVTKGLGMGPGGGMHGMGRRLQAMNQSMNVTMNVTKLDPFLSGLCSGIEKHQDQEVTSMVQFLSNKTLPVKTKACPPPPPPIKEHTKSGGSSGAEHLKGEVLIQVVVALGVGLAY